MGTIYLVFILHKNLIYSKFTLINVSIILKPFMLIIILEYTCNMLVHIHSKYTFINPNTPLYIHRVATKLLRFATNGTYIDIFG